MPGSRAHAAVELRLRGRSFCAAAIGHPVVADQEQTSRTVTFASWRNPGPGRAGLRDCGIDHWLVTLWPEIDVASSKMADIAHALPGAYPARGATSFGIRIGNRAPTLDRSEAGLLDEIDCF